MPSEKKAFAVNSNMVSVHNVLYPVTHKFVVKRHEEVDEMEQYTGLIYEYYNSMPWGSDSYGRYTAASMRMACSYINFTSVTYDFGGGFSYTEEDSFGLTFQLVNQYGENSLYGGPLSGMGWSELEAYSSARRGGYGAVISASEPYQYGSYGSSGFIPDAYQPSTYTGSGCNYVSLSGGGSASGANNTWEFGFLGCVFTGNLMYIGDRAKDMVMWFYDLAYDIGGYHYELDTTGIPNDAVFLPGQSGMRKISNHYKYAPWERYPHLV
jgi:hypothetical protein|nr:hypothetical protein [uncultured bacterium]